MLKIFSYFHRSIVHIATVLTFAYTSVICWAAANDGKEPIYVEADQMQYDNENKISRYSGSVVAKQGTLTIHSAHINVRQDSEGNQLGVATGTETRRAFFRQDRDNANEYIEGEALRLEYDSRTSTVKLVGDATLRRYRNNQLVDQTSGGIITYNDNTSFFTVENGKNRNSRSGRVTSVFTPNKDK